MVTYKQIYHNLILVCLHFVFKTSSTWQATYTNRRILKPFMNHLLNLVIHHMWEHDYVFAANYNQCHQNPPIAYRNMEFAATTTDVDEIWDYSGEVNQIVLFITVHKYVGTI